MKLLLVLFIPSLSFASCDIADVINTVRPNSQWAMRGNSVEGLEWQDTRQTKPTKKEIDDAVATCKQNEILIRQQKDQAKIDLNTASKTDAQRITAIIKYLELDK